MEFHTFRVRGSHALRQAFPDLSATYGCFSLHGSSPCGPTTPLNAVWAVPLSLAATHGISGGSLLFLISFPELLRWFTSLSLSPEAYFIQLFRCTPRGVRVTPFGYPGITGCLLLPPAFRSLPRPSSPSGSQASDIDLYSLDHIIFSSCARFLPLLQARPARYGTPRSPRRTFQPSSGYLAKSSRTRSLPFRFFLPLSFQRTL